MRQMQKRSWQAHLHFSLSLESRRIHSIMRFSDCASRRCAFLASMLQGCRWAFNTWPTEPWARLDAEPKANAVLTLMPDPSATLRQLVLLAWSSLWLQRCGNWSESCLTVHVSHKPPAAALLYRKLPLLRFSPARWIKSIDTHWRGQSLDQGCNRPPMGPNDLVAPG